MVLGCQQLCDCLGLLFDKFTSLIKDVGFYVADLLFKTHFDLLYFFIEDRLLVLISNFACTAEISKLGASLKIVGRYFRCIAITHAFA